VTTTSEIYTTTITDPARAALREDALRLLWTDRAKAPFAAEWPLDAVTRPMPVGDWTYSASNRYLAAAATPHPTGDISALPDGSALLVVTRGPGRGAWFPLDQSVTTVGRHIDSDIFLDDATVSRRHAEFRCDDGEFHLMDVGSLNGTYLNRSPVDSAPVADGDEIRIGKFRLAFLTTPLATATDVA